MNKLENKELILCPRCTGSISKYCLKCPICGMLIPADDINVRKQDLIQTSEDDQ